MIKFVLSLVAFFSVLVTTSLMAGYFFSLPSWMCFVIGLISAIYVGSKIG